MDTIVVGFSKPNGWFEPFSWLIRLITWSPYSHAYIKYQNTYADRWTVFQASGLKVNFIGENRFSALENIYAEFEIPVSKEIKKLVVTKAIDKCGAPYGLLEALGYVWVIVMKWIGKSVRNPFNDKGTFVCSELVGDVLIEMQEGKIDPSAMSPKDIYNFLISKGLKQKGSV